MDKEAEELLQKRFALDGIIDEMREEIKSIELTSNNEIYDLYVKVFNDLKISDRVLELDFDKFKTEVEELAKENKDRNVVKIWNRIKTNRQLSFIAPTFQVINQYFMEREELPKILKDKYRKEITITNEEGEKITKLKAKIVPIGLDSITLNIVGSYLTNKLALLEDKYTKRLEKTS
jgi:hypothetical protein